MALELTKRKYYVAPNGKLYKDVNFYSWNCTIIIDGVGSVYLHPSAEPDRQRANGQIVTEDNFRLDLIDIYR